METLCTLKHNAQPSGWAFRIIKLIADGRKLSADRYLPLHLIPLHNAILNVNHAMRVFGNVMFVGHQNDRVSLRLQAIHQRHDFVSGLRIQIPGRFRQG